MVLRNDKIYTVWSAGVTVKTLTLWANILDFHDPIVKVENTPEISVHFQLLRNYPNPFNSSTIISYIVPHRSQIQISIYNILGQEIVRLQDEEVAPGQHQIHWDGKDQTGKDVVSSVYIYRLKVSSFVQAQKMLLIR